MILWTLDFEQLLQFDRAAAHEVIEQQFELVRQELMSQPRPECMSAEFHDWALAYVVEEAAKKWARVHHEFDLYFNGMQELLEREQAGTAVH